MTIGTARRCAALAGFFGALLAGPALSQTVVSEPREVERLLRQSSSPLVSVSIQVDRMRDEVINADESIPLRRLTFHVPASTALQARTRADTGQLLGFRLWNCTLDPVRRPRRTEGPGCEVSSARWRWS